MSIYKGTGEVEILLLHPPPTHTHNTLPILDALYPLLHKGQCI